MEAFLVFYLQNLQKYFHSILEKTSLMREILRMFLASLPKETCQWQSVGLCKEIKFQYPTVVFPQARPVLEPVFWALLQLVIGILACTLVQHLIRLVHHPSPQSWKSMVNSFCWKLKERKKKCSSATFLCDLFLLFLFLLFYYYNNIRADLTNF